MFAMTSDGSAYARLRRAIAAGNLAIITATAAELRHIGLRDALGILLVIEAEAEERFDAAAVRWAGRLALETPGLELVELSGALESLHALPDEHAQRSLFALTDRHRPLRDKPPREWQRGEWGP
jgi:hypothetical protein